MNAVALLTIGLVIVTFAVAIVMLGFLPARIARQRNHPYPDLVNAASWIGVATGILWPIALIWAFVPIPTPSVRAAIHQRRKRLISMAVALLIGSSVLGLVTIVWNQAAPMSSRMFLRRHVLQVAPDVEEFVSKVYVEPDQRVNKGDPLFEIRPDRFQDAVESASSQLTAAQATVSQFEASVEAAKAAVKKSKAHTAAAKAELDTAITLQKDTAAAVAKLQVVEAQQGFRAARANDNVQQATLKQTGFSLAAAQHSVDVSQAALTAAEFNRMRCTYLSPVDGQVVNWQINDGTPAARYRFTASGTVMDLSDSAIIAIFPQNQLNNVKVGDVAEVAFKRRPGQIVTGIVDRVVMYTGEGQFLPSPTVPIMADVGSKGDLAIRIRLDDEALAKDLPMGAAGAVAVYTDFGRTLHLLSKIKIRVSAWKYYLPF